MGIKGGIMSNITPYRLADGIFYRLGKKIEKREMGITMKACKELITLFNNKGWEDYEVWDFVDTLIHEMKKNSFPLVFRMFYTITFRYLSSPKYVQYEDKTQSIYREWINNAIAEMKNC